jgi:hypothetical protein
MKTKSTMKINALCFFAFLSSAASFSPLGTNGATKKTLKPPQVAFVSEGQKSIFDPLGLYPRDSPERIAGVIEPLETPPKTDNIVIDPLSLYQNKAEVTADITDMSISLPFLKRPDMLDGSLPGDRGFDPFNFSSDASALIWYRDSEIRHARLAMLATVGWPVAELFHKILASNFDLQPVLAQSDKAPSLLNGGLAATSPLFWVAAISATAALEFISTKNEGKEPGDFGFDPLRLAGKNDSQKFFMKEAEIFNGRLAMLAITGFAIQEFITNIPVINQTPVFFKPFGDVVAQILHSTSGVSL